MSDRPNIVFLLNGHEVYYRRGWDSGPKIIWEGNNPETVWLQVGGGFPGGHFWLHNLNTWDGIISLE